MVASTGVRAQTHQQSSLALPSLQLLRGSQCQSKGWVYVSCTDTSCAMFVVPHWHRSLTWILGPENDQGAGSQLGVHLPVPLTLEEGEPWGQ